MELYVSGVKPPKLGSIQDIISRRYLLKKINREVTLNKLIAQMVSSSHDSPQWSREVNNIWSDYVNQSFYADDAEKETEISMQEEYRSWKHIRPVLHREQGGRVTVSGLPKELLPEKRKELSTAPVMPVV